jgi:chromosome segregation ATPase
MSDIDGKILKKLDELQAGQQALQADVQQQGTRLEAVEAGQKTLASGQQALELKVEAIHTYQKQAHTEIMDSLFHSNEMTGKAQQKLEEQVEHIKKHVGLPPLK